MHASRFTIRSRLSTPSHAVHASAILKHPVLLMPGAALRRSRIIIVQDGREGRRRRPPRLISRRTFVHTMTTKRTYSNPIVRIGNWREDEALELVRRRSFFCGSCTSVRGFFFENVFPVQHFPVQVFARLTRCARRAKRDRSLATLSARGLCVPAMFCNDRRNLKRTSRLKEMALDT